MAITLFEHNAKAYTAAVSLMQRTGKAAVIHPTGTGKSYIAFKLIEDNPDANILWLSPSDYIFKTQKENLAASNPELSLANVRFCTYAKLMLLPQEEILTLEPDYIILDEFHRAAAQQWSVGVQRLFDAYPVAKLLGLSATSVRYLDSNRDVGREIFGESILTMTLGEAIVRGILPCPTYVTTLFQYQNALLQYQKRVENCRVAGIQDTVQQYYEALRRALEKADGLPQLFKKYLQNKSGKYIVFCSDYDHIRELRNHTGEWFGGVNADIHEYVAYSADPATSKAFASFKMDESSALKLLFCIDMLNEGVHVKGVSGVILFRPTVSPIVYKQQIGRALTAGTGGTPLILDIVNNFDGLYTIDNIQEEMLTAVQRLYRDGEGSAVVAERFQIIELQQDVRALFERLDNSLNNSWEQYFNAASVYAAEYGNLQVPLRYRTPGGLNLGNWVVDQRRLYKMNQSGTTARGQLTPQQIERLESIGMKWESVADANWESKLALCRAYKEEHGDLLVPLRYVTEDGVALGKWIANLRNTRADRQRQQQLTPDRIAQLDELGMVWNVSSLQWEKNFLQAMTYYSEHGDLTPTAAYKTKDGFALGNWLRKQRYLRQDGKLSEQQIQRLDDIGMVWESLNDKQWEHCYRAAEAYFAEHGDLNVRQWYTTPDGIQLGAWLGTQRSQYRRKARTLTPSRIQRLEAIGMDWREQDPWLYRYELVKQYIRQTGSAKMPQTYKTADGIWLGKWFALQRKAYNGESNIQRLDEQKRHLLQKLNTFETPAAQTN